MTVGRVTAILTRILTIVVLAASGTYLLVYLYRWEWNRALVAGLFFVGAEVALVGSLILARLDRLSRRLDSGRLDAADRTYDRLRGHPTPPRDSFAWLRSDDLPVFVPVLLGAGVILSALAHVVQRVATRTVDPVADRGLAVRLAAFAPPEGGLVPPPGGDRVPAHRLLDQPPGPEPPGWRDAVLTAVGLAVGGLLLWGAIDVLADATQARPDEADPGTVTVIALEVVDRDAVGTVSDEDLEADAEALVVACRPRLPSGATVSAPRVLDEGLVQLTVTPALGNTGSRRFRGCLEDATLERIDARLRWMERVEVAPDP